MLAKLRALIGLFSERPPLTGLAALACGALFGGLEYGIMRGMGHSGVPPAYQSAADGAIIGIGTGVFAWVLLCVNRAHRRRVREEIARIAELNHEIRNALQVIAHSQYAAAGEHREMVLQSVSRIDAVLKRVVPMLGVERRKQALELHQFPGTRPADGKPVLKCTSSGRTAGGAGA